MEPNLVGGSYSKKRRTKTFGLPIFNSVNEAKKELQPDATMIYVPPKFAANAIIEAVEAEIELIVCITEGFQLLIC